jgi:hypothetical protein
MCEIGHEWYYRDSARTIFAGGNRCCNKQLERAELGTLWTGYENADYCCEEGPTDECTPDCNPVKHCMWVCDLCILVYDLYLDPICGGEYAIGETLHQLYEHSELEYGGYHGALLHLMCRNKWLRPDGKPCDKEFVSQVCKEAAKFYKLSADQQTEDLLTSGAVSCFWIENLRYERPNLPTSTARRIVARKLVAVRDSAGITVARDEVVTMIYNGMVQLLNDQRDYKKKVTS